MKITQLHSSKIIIFGLFLFILLFLFACNKDKNSPSIISDEVAIISFNILNNNGIITGNSIKVNVPFGTDITKLKADVKISDKATISPDPSSVRDYTHAVKFTVTAEDGKTKNIWTVTLEVAKNNQAKILEWKFSNVVATISKTDISANLTFEADITKLKARVKLSVGASINPNPSYSIDYKKPVNFIVTSEDGKIREKYKVTVKVENPIISWTAGWRDSSDYTANIDHETGKINIDLTSADFDTKVTLVQGVSIKPDPNKVDNWSGEVTFTTKKGSKTKIYEVKVKVNGKDIIKATDLANLKIIMNGKTTGNFNHIDVSSVTNMEKLFQDKATFDGDISKWDVSNVTNMSGMFQNAPKFNQNLNSWNVSKVESMLAMFNRAFKFNQDIGKWHVANVINMQSMFNRAKSFNKYIGNWKVGNVTNMGLMFNEARAFNQNLSLWNVSSVSECIFFSLFVNGWRKDYKPNFKNCTP